MAMKLYVIEGLDRVGCIKKVCDELGVGKTTVKNWQQYRKYIQDFCMNIESVKVLASIKKPNNC